MIRNPFVGDRGPDGRDLIIIRSTVACVEGRGGGEREGGREGRREGGGGGREGRGEEGGRNRRRGGSRLVVDAV